MDRRGWAAAARGSIRSATGPCGGPPAWVCGLAAEGSRVLEKIATRNPNSVESPTTDPP
jgi:hypothetical protein